MPRGDETVTELPGTMEIACYVGGKGMHATDRTRRFNLETAVDGEKDVQDIDVHGRFEKLVVT
jgi:hypothetical protein